MSEFARFCKGTVICTLLMGLLWFTASMLGGEDLLTSLRVADLAMLYMVLACGFLALAITATDGWTSSTPHPSRN